MLTIKKVLPGRLNCFAVVSGELTEVEITSIVLKVNKDKNEFDVKYVLKTAKDVFEWVSADDLYQNETDFRAGESYKKWFSDLFIAPNDARVAKFDECSIGIVYFYEFKNGQISLSCRDYDSIEYYVKTGKVDIPDLPNERYSSTSKAVLWNSYYVVDSEGNRTKRTCLREAIALSSEQKAICDKLYALLLEAKEANITLAYDTDDNQLIAYNKHEGVTLDCCPDGKCYNIVVPTSELTTDFVFRLPHTTFTMYGDFSMCYNYQE